MEIWVASKSSSKLKISSTRFENDEAPTRELLKWIYNLIFIKKPTESKKQETDSLAVANRKLRCFLRHITAENGPFYRRF
jgi:hypothetical protein